MIDVRVISADFDPGRQLARLGELKTAGVASFIGRVAGEDLSEVWIDHHAQLARSEMLRIAEEAQERWTLDGAILIHRHGTIAPGGRIVFIGTASAAIEAAGSACSWILAEMERRTPFWRKDIATDGSSRWR